MSLVVPLPRLRDRMQSERVATQEEVVDEEEGAFINNNNNNDTIEEEEEETTEDSMDSETAGINRYELRPTATLAELEEEREMARRRTSACVLFAIFILCRIWIAALEAGDVSLLILCGAGTVWTCRWIASSRNREVELDRRIAEYIENGGNTNNNNNHASDSDMRMLSYQAQLALAIIESQRQAMMGGYGHPDGGEDAPGVSDASKKSWKYFEYQEARDKQVCYGSVEKGVDDDEPPHCSICLGDYEEGDKLVKLPCNHVYHADCIESWCAHHTRCPLCNFDLETAVKTTADTVDDSMQAIV